MGRAIPLPSLCACVTCNVTALRLHYLSRTTWTFKMELAMFCLKRLYVCVNWYSIIFQKSWSYIIAGMKTSSFACWKHMTGSHWISVEEQGMCTLCWSRHSFQCSVKVLHKQGSKFHHIYFWPRHLVVSCWFQNGLWMFALFPVLLGALLCKHDICNFLTSIQSWKSADSCLGSSVTVKLGLLFIFCRIFASDGDGNISFFNICLSSFSVAATNHQHFQLKAGLITQLLRCHQMDARLLLSMKVTQTNFTHNWNSKC